MLRDERLKLTLGIFFILFSLYLYLAFISYFFTWKTDQSFIWSNVFSGPEVRVDNWAGKFGAFLANKFINHWFGIASAVLPFILLISGLRFINITLGCDCSLFWGNLGCLPIFEFLPNEN